MNCIVCGALLTASDYCPQCGCHVAALKKTAALSNLYYNQGLEKAQIRDLSGAITCLKRSLKMNKMNIQARNLLGLVYFETGEVVAALSEWVISKNMQPEDNLASGYIDELQKNANRLGAINTSIKKYNQCLEYCRNDNPDMAKMQLKKVLSVNPKLIKGYHLLALIYIYEQDYEKARRQLKTAAKIDKTNTTTLRFLKEIEEQTGRATNLDSRFRMREREQEERDGKVIYKSGNDYVIQPAEYKEKTITGMLVNMILGLLVGAAALWFLVVPAVTQKINHEANQKVVEYSQKMAAQAAELSKMQEEMETSKDSIDTAKNQIEEADGRMNSYENLIKAWQAYKDKKYDNAANAIEGVVMEDLSVEGKAVYDQIMAAVGYTVKQNYQTKGEEAAAEEDYVLAAEYFEKALTIGKMDKETIFRLAEVYEKNGSRQKAIRWYQKLVEDFPGTKVAKSAQTALTGMGVTERDMLDSNDADAVSDTDGAAEDGTDNGNLDEDGREGQPVEE